MPQYVAINVAEESCVMSVLEKSRWRSGLMASDLEFRYRFWIFAAIYWTGFSAYAFDHKNAGHMIAQSVAHLRGAAHSTLDHRVVFAVAALLAVLASNIRTWATAYLRPEVMVSMRFQTSRLVADGPYRWVRNPLYLGNILFAIGMGLMASRFGFAFLVICNIVFVCRLILREEVELEAAQGDSYRAYRAMVPRLLPSLYPRVSSARRVPDYAGGVLGELFFWAFTASLVVFAATLDQQMYFWSLGAAFVVYALSMLVIKRRGKRSGAAA
jgi:protein-S-isoprenylcysteine O-methyltransferase Ste14